MTKPTYSDDAVSLYCGDSFRLLDDLGVRADITLTDIPYGPRTKRGARGNRGKGKTEAIVDFEAFDDQAVLCAIDAMARVTERWIICFMDWEHVGMVKAYAPDGWDFVRMGIWVKTNSAPQLTGDRPAMGWEALAILHRKGRKRWNSGGHRAVWHHPIARARQKTKRNKTEKPEGLIAELIQDFADPNGLIVDPFMGTGTTCVAAKRRGYRSLGVDIREGEVADAANRCRQETFFQRLSNQGTLDV